MIQWNRELYHYGIPRRSGRYKWGSGKDPYHHGASISGRIKARAAKSMQSVKNASANRKAKKAAMTPEERRARRNRNIKIAAGVGITVGAAIAARQMYKHRNPEAANDIKAIIENAQRRKDANNWVGNNPIGGKVSSPNLHGSHEKMGKMVGAGYKESNWVNKNPIGGNVTGGKLRSTHEKMGKMAGANSLDRENARRYIRAANRPVELTSNSAKERYREAKQNMRSANKFDKHLRKDIPLESIGNADRRRNARNAYFKFSADNARRTEIYNKAKSDLRNERRENLRSAPERAITKARSTAKRAGDEAYYKAVKTDMALNKARNRAPEVAGAARDKARSAARRASDKAFNGAVRVDMAGVKAKSRASEIAYSTRSKARSAAKRAGDEAYYRTLRADMAVTKAKNRAPEAAAAARDKAKSRASEIAANARTKARNARDSREESIKQKKSQAEAAMNVLKTIRKNDEAPKRAVRKRRAVRKTH